MPPNANVKGIVQIARPFAQPVYPRGDDLLEEASAVYHQSSGQGAGRQHEVAEDAEQPVRITTRARITYELDRFSKNVMLLIDNSDSVLTPLYLQHSFELRNFQVTFINAQDQLGTNTQEVWEKIHQFFEQDFSDIGAAAVVMFTSYAARPVVSLADGEIEECELLRYFTDNQPPALQGKPKIFISEAPDSNPAHQQDQSIIYRADRILAATMSPSPVSPQPAVFASDVLLIQAKILHDYRYRCPLDLLCYSLISMDDGADLQDMLVTKFFPKARELYPTTAPIITCHSTLTKHLLLEKTANAIDKYSVMPILMENFADFS